MNETYILLRTALNLFQKSPQELNEEEFTKVKTQSAAEIRLEEAILVSQEAVGVFSSEQEVDNAFKEIQQRYKAPEQFLSELERNGMSEKDLRAALARQCKINAILHKIGDRIAPVEDTEIGLYYHLHKEQFHKPERRTVSHIFISINDDYPENTRENAWRRINELREKLVKIPSKFGEYALKYSECPTALQSGQLGTVARGKLYPELESALFKMRSGQISQVIESEIGFHILLCEKIHKASKISYTKAAPKIRRFLNEQAREKYIQNWVRGLSR